MPGPVESSQPNAETQQKSTAIGDISSFASNIIQNLTISPLSQLKTSTNNTKTTTTTTTTTAINGGQQFNMFFDTKSNEEQDAKRIADYAKQFINPSSDDKETLCQLILTRLHSSGGEFIMELGVDDRGNSLGFTKQSFDIALSTVQECAKNLRAFASLLHVKSQSQQSVTGHVLLRQQCNGKAEDLIEIRVACTGNVDAGKSTLLGVLVSGDLDDGRGAARVNLFKHKHEQESGRTSSVGMEMMGFDNEGKQVAKSTTGRRMAWEDVTMKSSKILTFLDLAGHEKYLKTTVYGMTGCAPDYVMLIVGSNAGIIGMTKEHLGLALALNVPVMVVITKIDMCPPNILESTIKQVTKIMKSPGCKKMPIFIKDMEDVIMTSHNFVSERICPIFQVSSVSGIGYDLLKQFLNILPVYQKYDVKKPAEYQITETFSVPGVGTVVSGTLLTGVIHAGDTLLLGPDSNGQFIPCVIKSIQRKRVNIPQTLAGQSSSLALKKIKRSAIRRSMVLIAKETMPKATWDFEAEVLVLYHSSTIAPRYQAMVHCGNIRQTAKIVGIRALKPQSSANNSHNNDISSSSGSSTLNSTEEEEVVIRTGDRAIVRFRFLQYPEFIKTGSRVLFREGRTKGVGKITDIFPGFEGMPS